MSDAWNEIQAIKSKRNSLREKLEKRKKERQDILSSTTLKPASSGSGAHTGPTIKTESGSEDKKVNLLLAEIGSYFLLPPITNSKKILFFFFRFRSRSRKTFTTNFIRSSIGIAHKFQTTIDTYELITL